MNTTTQHGNFLQIDHIGVWLTGEPRIGKSTLSLALIDRGHRLISDDAVLLQYRRNKIMGRSPESTQGFLWIAGMGVIDIAKLYGKNALLNQCELHLIIHLVKPTPESMIENLFNPKLQTVTFFNQSLPQIIFPIRENHMPLLIETMARNHRLQQQGEDARDSLEIPCNEND